LKRSEDLLAGLDALGLSGECCKKTSAPDMALHDGYNSAIPSPALWPEFGHNFTETAEISVVLLETLANTWVAAASVAEEGNDSKKIAVTKRDQACQHECFYTDEEEPYSPSSRSGISVASTSASSGAPCSHRVCDRKGSDSTIKYFISSELPSLKSLETIPCVPQAQQGSLPTSEINAEAMRIMSKLFHSGRQADVHSQSETW
jgi:hypothetical protein